MTVCYNCSDDYAVTVVMTASTTVVMTVCYDCSDDYAATVEMTVCSICSDDCCDCSYGCMLRL